MLSEYNILTLRMEMLKKGWKEQDDNQVMDVNSPYWGLCDLTQMILEGHAVAGLTQLDLLPSVVDDGEGNFTHDVYASCMVDADGSLRDWSLIETFAGTAETFDPSTTTLADLGPVVLTAWLKSLERGWTDDT